MSFEAALTEGRDGLYLNIHAQPGARKPQLRGMHGDAVKIAVAEAAQDGKANEAIIRFVASALDLARADVEVASGHTSRRKRLFLHGEEGDLRTRLQLWLDL
ncbi:MAG: hypothetical protein COW18_01810 [Zetaproteobacteria bacterium CG12_big_fil_rev_8_21_14_0_65_54_13]|nr:MAG: hypothetical protein COX55_00645 [Zetaproteobacteria bacterium CG23_combo_of_CG06-09_8_20_14_all_54_7]PIW51321.1 MAG: hypothetical protein COW18_01810 [Zetaproteobacteria bacterium CG12_big_fil_rev_8_21_14_0_65_54_13]PIX53331.1 MAG: hypothetical protein COZ50_14035 [Zetaproteobacteria bacterium CG_4_10_14_3_um_filter_54_28]PJA29627.1 MAG: hypothetical protein CO188_06425 [Zetaproteobacteria bacterium CG_4_9_14_3_um_filter_54_145]